ncbi:MAG: OsmC family protein [Candidatus Thorarchaeota archaeon]
MSEDASYYDVRLVWSGRKNGELIVEGKPMIRTGMFEEDEKAVKYHSPEDLFVASAAVCYMNGFVEFTHKMRISFNSFECEARGTLEKVGRSFEITQIDMNTKVSIESEKIRAKIERALKLAAKYCFIGNSMKCPISHEFEIII